VLSGCISIIRGDVVLIREGGDSGVTTKNIAVDGWSKYKY